MKKIISTLLVLAFTLSNNLMAALAIDFVPSSTELRFSEANPTQTFTVTLSDDPEKFAGKDKTIKAKLKLKKKYFETNLQKNIIEIPVVDGVVGTSQEITVTLKNPELYEESFSSTFKIKGPKKLAKKLSLKALKDDLFVDIGNIKVSGKVATTLGASTSSLKSKTINPLGRAAFVKIELRKVNIDGTIDEEILAESVTDDEGSFSIELPVGAQLGIEYVIVVPSLGYSVFASKSTDLEIDPINHYVTGSILTQKADPDFSPDENFNDLIESLAKQIKDIEANLDGDDLDEILASLDGLFKDFIENLLKGMEAGSSYCTDPENDDFSDLELATKGIAGEKYNVVSYRSEIGGSTSENTFFDEKRATETFEYGDLSLSKPNCFTGLITIDPNVYGNARAELIKFTHLEEGSLEPFENDSPDFCHEGTEHYDAAECQAHHDSKANDGDDHKDDTHEGDENVCHDPTTDAEIECPVDGEEPKCKDPETGETIACEKGEDEHGEGPKHEDDSCFILHADHHDRKTNGHDKHPLFASVNEFNVISLIDPPKEEDHESEGGHKLTIREKNSKTKLFPVGNDVYLSTESSGVEAYDKDGTTKLFDQNEIGFMTVVKKSDLNVAELSKTYGYIGFSTDLGDTKESDGRIELQTFKGILSLNAGEVTLDGAGKQLEINSIETTTTEEEATDEKSCCNYKLTADAEEVSFTGAIKSQDSLIKMSLFEQDDSEDKNDDSPRTGFTNKDGSLLFFLTADDRNTGDKAPEAGSLDYRKDKINSASREFAVALELGNPTIAGNTYYILSYKKALNASGGITLTHSNSAVTPTITFNSSSTATVDSINYTSIGRDSCDGDISISTETSVISNPDYTMSSSGAMEIEIGGSTLSGFASADGNLIALQSIQTTNSYFDPFFEIEAKTNSGFDPFFDIVILVKKQEAQ